MTSAARVVVLVSVLAGVGGCGKKNGPPDYSSIEAIREKHRGELEALCRPVIEKAANVAGPLAEDKVTDVAALTEATAAVMTEGMAKVIEDGMAKGGPTKEHDYQYGGSFAETKELGRICDWILDGDSSVPDGFMFGDSGELPIATIRKNVDAGVARVLALRHVVLIHVLEYTGPLTEGSTFTPGRVVAEARIIDHKGGDHGGFRFEAASSTSVQSMQTVDGKGQTVVDNSSTAVDADLATNARKAFAEKLVKLVPGSTFTLPF